jgi:8-oxo-dGTP diphosphatase
MSEMKHSAEPKTEYVLGFMFSAAFDRVALIRKNKPDWQRGKLNGIGGKIESESKYLAMIREFKEECGYQTHREQWDYYCRMEGNGFTVHCFATVGDLSMCKTCESEKVEIVYVKHLLTERMIENLPWLIHLAIDYLEDRRPLFTVAAYDQPAPFAEIANLRAELAKNKAAREWVEKWAGYIDSPHFHAPIPTAYDIDRAKTELRAIIQSEEKE